MRVCVRTCARVHVYFSVHVFVSSIMTLAGRFSTLHPLYTRANCKYVSQFVFQGMSDAAPVLPPHTVSNGTSESYLGECVVCGKVPVIHTAGSSSLYVLGTQALP